MTQELKGGKLCQYFGQPRGCIKGDRCEYHHATVKPGQPTPIIVKDKICEYFLKPRGCNKGKDCDFKHPDLEENEQWTPRMQLAPKSIPCQFFGSARGCIKGDTCDFLHSTGISALGVEGGGIMHDLPRICKYFTTPEGCFSGMDCEFAHITQEMLALSNLTGGIPTGGGGSSVTMTPNGPVNKMGILLQPTKCEFFLSPGGCPKQSMCEFIHQKQKPCEYLLSTRGCRKGPYCDFLHTDASGNPLLPEGGAGKMTKPATTTNRYAPY